MDKPKILRLLDEFSENERAILILSKEDDYQANHVIDRLRARQREIIQTIVAAATGTNTFEED